MKKHAIFTARRSEVLVLLGLSASALSSCRAQLLAPATTGADGSAGSSSGTGSSPTQLVFAFQPRTISVTAPFSATVSGARSAVQVAAYSDSLCEVPEASGLLTSPAPVTPVSGVAALPGLSYGAIGSFYLGASAVGSDPACSDEISAVPVNLYLATQDSADSKVYLFSYNPATGSMTEQSSVIPPAINGTLLRILLSLPDGNLLAAGGLSEPDVNFLDSNLAVLGSLSLSGGPVPLGNTTGACVLPDGDLVFGEYSGNEQTNEYTSSGSYVRAVYTGETQSWPVGTSTCQATSATDLFLLDANLGATNTASQLQHLQLDESGAWQVASNGTFSYASFSTSTGANYVAWTFLARSDGYVYMPPAFPNTAGNGFAAPTQFVRCPQSDLTNQQCTVFGQPIPSSDTTLVAAMAPVPGSADFLYSSEKGIYRFSVTTGQSRKLFDSTTLPNLAVIRGMAVQAVLE